YRLWFNASAYHNLPVINGQQQDQGRLHRARQVSYRKDKVQTSLAMNIEQAYPLPSLAWKRTIASDHEKISVTDISSSAKPLASLTQSFMTVCNVDIDQPGIIRLITEHGAKVSIRYENDWQPTKETISLTTEEDQGLKLTWHDKPITRILLTHRLPIVISHFQYLITKE
ncbi:MAG TPA: hypothetical protein VFP87_03280, partial [Chitinophagaceae bacterium]|nr:hypothetical protein [Chitinophagaceae bacterium]